MAPSKGFDLNDAPMADEEAEAEAAAGDGAGADAEMETEADAAMAAPVAAASETEGEEMKGAEEEEVQMEEEAEVEVEEEDTELYIRGRATGGVDGQDAPSSFSFREVDSAEDLGIDEDLDILYVVWNAYEDRDLRAIDDILSGLCEAISRTPLNCNRYHYLACMYVSKKLPELFALRKTCTVLLGFFSSIDYQAVAKKQLLLPSLASKLLSRAFEALSNWPLEFIRVYLDDAVGARLWIDHDGCKEFVANIVTAFSDSMPMGTVKNRYQDIEIRRIAREEFLKAIQFLLRSSTSKENLRQLLKLLIQGVGYEEVRVIGSSMLESWLNSPIHLRAAKTLLDEILDNLHGITENDITTLNNLLALRVQSSQSASQMKALHGNIYTEMITHLVSRRLEYGGIALRTFVLAEITAKNLFNMKCISIAMKAMPSSAAPEYELASVLQEHALNADTRPQLQELGRRLVKYMGQELNLRALCHGLFQPWREIINKTQALREIWLMQIINLACQFLLCGISHLTSDEIVVQWIKELERCKTGGWSACANFSPPQETLSMLKKISSDVMTFQVEALDWCTNVLPTIFPEISSAHFSSIIMKFLFLQNLEEYFSAGEKCGDVEVICYRIVCASTQGSEDILARVIYMGISNDFPLAQAEALEIVERLVWRAAASARYLSCSLKTDNVQLPMAIFKLASFNFPGAMSQPTTELVYKELYWRCCIVVLIIAVNNAKKIGSHVWESIPTVRHLMELLLTCEGKFDQESYKEKEANDTEMEFITAFMSENPDLNSSGFSMGWGERLMILDHSGNVRKAPPYAVKEIEKMENLYLLSQLLQRCTDPDFFVEITTSQTLPRSWPWLRKVLVKNPTLVNRLPLPWQVELLYVYEGFYPEKGIHTMDVSHIYRSLHMAVTEDHTNKFSDIEVVFDFILHRFVSMESCLRARARRCFAGILDPSFLVPSDSRGENFDWLVLLDTVKFQHQLLEKVSSAICKAVLLESSCDVVVAYLVFLREHLPSLPSPHSLALTVANLVIERPTLTKSLLQYPQGLATSIDFFQNPSVSASQSIDVGGMFVKTLREALETGIMLSDESMTLPIVTLVLSRPCDVVKKQVPRCVVDAAIEVLALISMTETEKSDDYETLLELLFPGVVCSQTKSNTLFVVKLEDSSGKEVPLLCETKAIVLARCGDTRLVKAGLSMLGNTVKIESCASLGRSFVAVSGFIEELKPIFDMRFADIQKEACYVTNMKNGWKKMSLINLMWQHNSESKAPKVSKEAGYQSNMSDEEPEENTSGIVERLWRSSFHDIIQGYIPLGEPIEFVLSYLQVRKHLREVNFCSEPETWIEHAELPTEPIENKRVYLEEPLALRLQVPLYISLGGSRAALVLSDKKKRDIASASIIKQLFCILFENVEMVVDQILGAKNSMCPYNLSHIASQTLIFMREMDTYFFGLIQRKRSSQDSHGGLLIEPGLLDLDNLTFENVEFHVMKHMKEQCSTEQNHDNVQKLMEKVFGLITNQSEALKFVGGTCTLNEHVARAGISAVYFTLMKFSYPRIILHDHLIEILNTTHASMTELLSKRSLVPLALQWFFNQSSWEVSIKTLHFLLGRVVDKLGAIRNIEVDDTGTNYALLNLFLSLGSMLDFVDHILCLPHMHLVSSCHGSGYTQELFTEVTASIVSPSAVKNICILVIVVSMLSIWHSRKSSMNRQLGTSIFKSIEDGQRFRKYGETASRVLIYMAGQNDGMLRMIVKELWERSRTMEWGSYGEPQFRKLLDGELKASAKNLILALYMIWPVSVESAIPVVDRKDILTVDIPFDINRSYVHECMLEQVKLCKSIIQKAVTSSICESIEENAAPLRFCRTFAKQHPTLFLYSMPSIGALLKEFIPMIKLEDIVRNKVACSLKTGITVLDVLRPYIFQQGDTKQKCHKLQSGAKRQCFPDDDYPSSVLNAYICFLQCLEPTDVAHYGKVIAKLADFLCHCVNSGGQWCEFVKKHQEVLEAAAKKFSKIKKLSYISTLLNNTGSQSSNGKTTLLQPPMPLEEIKAVREQLLQFSYFGKVQLPLDDSCAPSRNNKRRWDQELLEMEGKESNAGLLATLVDLELASSRLPTILSLLKDVLVELMKVTDHETSEIVYKLLERSLYECPSDDNCNSIMEAMLTQLASRNSSLRKIAANQASRFFFFFPEFQERLLLELFQYAPEQLQKLLAELGDFLM